MDYNLKGSTMSETDTKPTDLLAYAVAMNHVGTSYLVGWMATNDTIPRRARDQLSAMLAGLRGQVAAVLANAGLDLGYYSTGLPVYTETTFPDCECSHFYLWHPDPQHDDNRPRDITVLACDNGSAHHLVVMGPGEIETTDLVVPGA